MMFNIFKRLGRLEARADFAETVANNAAAKSNLTQQRLDRVVWAVLGAPHKVAIYKVCSAMHMTRRTYIYFNYPPTMPYTSVEVISLLEFPNLRGRYFTDDFLEVSVISKEEE